MIWKLIVNRKVATILIPLAAVILGLVAYAPATAQTYFRDLPPNVLTVTIEGVTSATTDSSGAIDNDGPPVVRTTTPTFSGRIEPGPTSIEITIRSVEQTFTVPVDAVTGEWSFTVPEPLEPGEHSLYIDDALVGSFTVELAVTAPDSGQTITPPDSGNAGLAANGSGGSTSAGRIGLLGGLLALVLIAGYAVRRTAVSRSAARTIDPSDGAR